MNKSNSIINPLSCAQFKNQRGVVLIMSLSILMVLTLVGISAMKTSSLQERMSGNARDYKIAFEAAEIALRAGEDYLKAISTTVDFTTTGTSGKYLARTITSPAAYEIESNWTAGNTESITLANVSKDPEIMIEIVNSTYGQEDSLDPGGVPTGAVSLFRVTARGYGKNPNTKVMLQADFGKLM